MSYHSRALFVIFAATYQFHDGEDERSVGQTVSVDDDVVWSARGTNVARVANAGSDELVANLRSDPVVTIQPTRVRDGG